MSAAARRASEGVPKRIISTPPRPPPAKQPKVYSIRKRFLVGAYSHMISSNDVCLFFRHDALTTSEWNRLRSKLNPSAAGGNEGERVRIEVLRTGLLPPALRRLHERGALGDDAYRSFEPHLHGHLAALTQQTLSPPRLRTALAAIARQSAIPTATQAEAISRRGKNAPPPKTDRLPFALGLVEGKALPRDELDRVSKLPSLETLRQQIVGLVGLAGMRLVGTLRQASGGDVVRTVEGYRVGLEHSAS